MTREVTVDEAVILGLVENREAKDVYPILNRKQAQLSGTGCPRCPHKRARAQVDVKSIKQSFMAMTAEQAQPLKRILNASVLVFYAAGPDGRKVIKI